MICTIDTNNDLQTIKNGADVQLITSKVPNSNIWSHVNAQYSEVLSTTFQVAKLHDCSNNTYDSYFTKQEQQAINRWLNRLDNYYPFRIVQDGFNNVYYNAQINVNKIELLGKVIGFELTITTDKPYGYFEQQNLNFLVSPQIPYSFLSLSDDVGFDDITLTITCLDNGELTISNTMSNQSMIIKNCKKNEVITIDTRLRKVTSSIRTKADILEDFNFVWLKIGNTRKNRLNQISSNMQCKISLSYYPTCKLSF